MPVAPHEPRQDEQVYAWRLWVLLQAGYPIVDAERLAGAEEIDLHHAVELLEDGCDVTTAIEILL